MLKWDQSLLHHLRVESQDFTQLSVVSRPQVKVSLLKLFELDLVLLVDLLSSLFSLAHLCSLLHKESQRNIMTLESELHQQSWDCCLSSSQLLSSSSLVLPY